MDINNRLLLDKHGGLSSVLLLQSTFHETPSIITMVSQLSAVSGSKQRSAWVIYI